MSDYVVNFGVVQEAQLLLQQNSKVFLYSFDYVSNQSNWYPYFKGRLKILYLYALYDIHKLILKLFPMRTNDNFSLHLFQIQTMMITKSLI